MSIAQYAIRNTQYATRNTLNAIPYTLSPIVKLINQLTISPINFQKTPLQLSRELYKSHLFLQNKANSPSVQDDTTAFSTRTYEILHNIFIPKNKAKQSQFKANFSSKLGSFFTILALFFSIFNRKGWGKDSKYKGLCWDKYNKKWRAQIHHNRKCRYLGVFEDEVEAAREYDKEAKKLFGEFAYLNFPQDNK